jgi:hypothetical protein
MSQSTFGDDDDLFGEAAAEMREDVEKHLDAAWESLPDADAVWETDADNVLGTLNGLRSALDAGDAEEHLRQAKKWYTMGERADAFEDASDLREEVERLEGTVADVGAAAEAVGDLAGTMPEIRSALQEGGGDRGGGGSESDADDGADGDGAEAEEEAAE